jgi:glucosylceramidase
VKFIGAYRKEGVPIWAITVQNEPRHETDSYPSMRMEPRDQARFIKDHLGPALASAGLFTKIFAWDHNWDGVDFPLEVLADAGARKHIDGVAFHGYGGKPDAQERIRQALPDQEIHFTESSGGAWATDFGGNIRWDTENLLVGSVRHGSQSVLKWNLALNEKYGPTNGGCNNCRGIVTIHSETGAVTRNEEYYAFGHSSKFVRPGARRIASTDGQGIANVAFRNPDGSRVWVACNAMGAAKTVTLRWRGSALTLRMAPGSLYTLRW